MKPLVSMSAHPPLAPAFGDVLTLALGTVVAMWAVGYIGWALGELIPPWVTVGGMIACLLAGGLLTGRLTGRPWTAGLAVGMGISILNLLILGSLIQRDKTNSAPPAALWLPGTVLATCLLCTIASTAGLTIANRKSQIANRNWSFRLTLVTLAATSLLLLAGGLVTGREAGLAVPDWPRSYGYNMFFYPLTRMKGNIYYEHAHRLLGSLVGLTTIALAAHLFLADRRKSMRCLVLVAVLAVIAQGTLGGLRVVSGNPGGTSGVEVARPINETSTSAALRVAHGVSAQLFLAIIASIATLASRAWRRASIVPIDGSLDRSLTALLSALLIVQLVLGALLRHLNWALMLHITGAAAVFFAGLITGLRLLGSLGSCPSVRRLSVSLLFCVLLQVLLGVAAVIVRSAPGSPPTTADVLTTTAHQLNGAALLAISVALMLLTRRITSPAPVPMTRPPSEPMIPPIESVTP